MHFLSRNADVREKDGEARCTNKEKPSNSHKSWKLKFELDMRVGDLGVFERRAVRRRQPYCVVIGQRKEMEGFASVHPGFASDSCESNTATPDQSPLTPIPILPSFLPFLGFSGLATSTLNPSQMYSMMFCGMGSAHSKLQLPPESMDQAPVFVNARQFHRILKRRLTRRNQNWQARKERNRSYLHESRHRHACNRERGPSGMFLPKAKPAQCAGLNRAETSMEGMRLREAAK